MCILTSFLRCEENQIMTAQKTVKGCAVLIPGLYATSRRVPSVAASHAAVAVAATLP